MSYCVSDASGHNDDNDNCNANHYDGCLVDDGWCCCRIVNVDCASANNHNNVDTCDYFRADDISSAVVVDARKRIGDAESLAFEQAPVGDNLWMPSASEQHIAARAFIFDGIRQDVHIKDFDFHKFNVDSLQDIKPPAPDAATLTQP